MSKARDFGLPSIGGGAAALLAPRRTNREEEDRREKAPLHVETQKPREQPVVAPHEASHAVAPLAPAATVEPAIPSKGGRPKGPPSKRMHLSIEEGLAAYLNRAWRTHERPDGSLAAGPADLIEDLLAEHRGRHLTKPGQAS